MRRNAFTVGWICALAHELEASVANLDEEYSHPEEQDPLDLNVYTYGRIGAHKVVMACLPEGTYGTVSAATVARDMQRSFPALRFGLMVGIGGGIWTTDTDVRLGDVVVSTPTQDFGAVIQYDLGKTMPGGRFQRVGFLNKPPNFLFSAMGNLRAKHNQTREFLSDAHVVLLGKTQNSHNDFSRPDASSDILYQSECQHAKTERCERCGTHLQILRAPRATKAGELDVFPEVHYGLIGSGNRVVADAEERNRLRNDAPILCFEMEAAGLMDSLPCLVIRGICDYADSYKHDKWQNYAAAMAAIYARRLLEVVPVGIVQSAQQISSKCWAKILRPSISDLLNEHVFSIQVASQSEHIGSSFKLQDSPIYNFAAIFVEQANIHLVLTITDRLNNLGRNPPLDSVIRSELDILESDQSLLVDSSHYWSHMTERGFQRYENIAKRMPFIEEGGCIEINAFAARLANRAPEVRHLIDIWERFGKGSEARLPRNAILAVLYMLHVEFFDPRFRGERLRPYDDGKYPISRDRAIALRCFGRWERCPHSGTCLIKRNFANNSYGLERDVPRGNVDCVVHIWRKEKTKSAGLEGRHGSVLTEDEKRKAEAALRNCRRAWTSQPQEIIL